jgi:hypothetical protein
MRPSAIARASLQKDLCGLAFLLLSAPCAIKTRRSPAVTTTATLARHRLPILHLGHNLT